MKRYISLILNMLSEDLCLNAQAVIEDLEVIHERSTYMLEKYQVSLKIFSTFIKDIELMDLLISA